MNKAQKAVVDMFKEHYDGWSNQHTFKDFAQALLAVDPTPDPKKYKIELEIDDKRVIEKECASFDIADKGLKKLYDIEKNEDHKSIFYEAGKQFSFETLLGNKYTYTIVEECN